ncbi:MAG: Crp/Fnr family transcriptional regulator [Acidobacteria bacterium]|nr:Crp/Fnr family transcriptional regulator [Acidobacteriota bacterium]
MQPVHVETVPSLESLICQHLLPMEGVTRILHCRRFTVLYTTGNPADSIFFLGSGLVKILKRGPDNKEVLLTLVRPGELFGEDALLLGGERHSSAEVLQEATISIIPKELLARFCNQRPEIWRLLAEMLARREQDLEQKIELLLMRDVEQRILLYLAELAEAVGVKEHEGGCTVQFSQGEIASLVGATRETTSSTLNSLARRGLLTLGRRRLIVADPEELRRVAGTPKGKSVSPQV